MYLKNVADGISTVVTWIINMAPFGIFGLVFNTVSTNGLDIFTTYGKLLLLLVGCMLFIYFVTNPLLVYWCIRKNPYPLIFHCLKRSALTAFFTRSSAANIPVNMKVCEEMGLDRDTYSVTIPLGATINMDGAAITITVMTIGNRLYPWHSCRYPYCNHLKPSGCSVSLWCIWCCRWFSASDSDGMLPVWHLR